MATGAAMLPAEGAARGGTDAAAFYDLGLSFSTGTGGRPLDLVEAHKWFNLAARRGSADAAAARAELALAMTAAQIAAAQKAARTCAAAAGGSAGPTPNGV